MILCSYNLSFRYQCFRLVQLTVSCIFSGLCAEEIHVCGESAAIDFVRELMYTTGEEVEVRLQNGLQQEERSLADVIQYSSLLS